MSLNTAHAHGGVLIHAGECIILFSEDVSMEFIGPEQAIFKGQKTGRIYLTTHRMIFINSKSSDPLVSFSFPFCTMKDVDVEQPMFGANFIKGKVRAQPNGNWIGEAKFKIVFKKGGAIDFCQAMLRAASLVKRHSSENDAPPPYMPPDGPWHQAAPNAYKSPPSFYGWAPPYQTFPNQPAVNSVYTTDVPPPYPGIHGYPNANGVGWKTSVPQNGYFDPSAPNSAFVPSSSAYNEPPPSYQESSNSNNNNSNLKKQL